MPARLEAGQRPLVVHIIHRLCVGGLENGVVNVINRMPDYAHAVVSMTDITDFADRIEREDVATYALDKRPGSDPLVHWRLWRLLRRLRPAIVHTRNIGTLECVLTAALAGVRIRVHGEHGFDMADVAGRNRKRVWLRRLLRPLVTRFVTVSRDLREWLLREVGVPEGQVTQIYNGVDTAKFHPATERRREALPFDDARTVIGAVGRLRPEKDQYTLLQAFIRLAERRDERLGLALIGGGDLYARIAAAVEEHSLHDDVWMPGDRDDVATLIRELDVFVLPSLGEGISNTVLEAMASGLPVVATAVGGNPELVEDGITGRLVPAGDAERLAEVLAAYLDEPRLRITQGAAGRARVERLFSLSSMARAYQDVYDALLAARGTVRVCVE